jgi:hypothetical protein
MWHYAERPCKGPLVFLYSSRRPVSDRGQRLNVRSDIKALPGSGRIRALPPRRENAPMVTDREPSPARSALEGAGSVPKV